MRKTITDIPIEQGYQYLRNHQLDEALAAMQQLYTKRQLIEGSDFSIHNQLLWCKILITKTRFSGNPSFAVLALKKLEELADFLPLETAHPTFLVQGPLQIQANLLLNNWSVAKQLALQLLQVAETYASPTQQIQAYHFLGEVAVQEGELEEALEAIRSSQKILFQQSKGLEEVVKIENQLLLGEILYQQKEYEQALFYCRKVLAASQNNFAWEEHLIKALLLSSSCARRQKEYGTAIQLLLEAKKRSEHIQHLQLTNKIQLFKGILYNDVYDHTRSIELLSGLASNNQFFLNERSISLLFNLELGKAYYYSQQFSKAQTLFNRVIQQTTNSKDLQEKVLALAFLSGIHAQQGELPQALRLAKKCNLTLNKLSGDREGSQLNLINLGLVHYKLKKYNEAIKLTSRGIATAKRLRDELNEIKGFELMAKIFQQQKDFKNAFLYQSIYTKFYEDFFVKNDRQIIRELEYNNEAVKGAGNK